MKLPGRTDELVERVLEANPNVCVVVQSGTPCEMPWSDRVPSIVQVRQTFSLSLQRNGVAKADGPILWICYRPSTEETPVVSLSVMSSLVTPTPAENYPCLSLIDYRTTLLTLTTLVRTAKATTTKTCLWAIEDWL
jgi:hypothetical protein